MLFTRNTALRLVFFTGLVLIVLGIAFLFGSMSGISSILVLGSLLFVIIGVVFAVLSIKFSRSMVYFFFAVFPILIGTFLFLSTMKIIPITLAQGWPLLSVFAGLALFPAGWHQFRGIRYRFLIPSLAFVALGCGLLIFSFKIVSFSFRRFMINWWPLLILLAGLILVLLSINPPAPKERGVKNRDGA
jgi:hypothetical protein